MMESVSICYVSFLYAIMTLGRLLWNFTTTHKDWYNNPNFPNLLNLTELEHLFGERPFLIRT